MEDIQEETSEQPLSPFYSEIRDTFGNPEALPRVGDKFQAEIPSLNAEFYSLQLIKMPAVNDFKPPPFGSPIPIMWLDSMAENINRIVEFENSKERQITSTNKLKVEPLLCPLPGSSGVSWTDIERDSFLLGLHIYGKNLVSVKNFVESKEMGDILSFYYGEFYKSKQYSRWSESRKLRNKRGIHGQRIFTGWRQQELLSRLFSRVSHECQNTLLELCRTFSEGKISLEEYVSTLKGMVGTNELIEAVGIGKGNRDLMEPAKANNNSFSNRPEIPFGKACSSVASADIIRFLTGGFRLSKARSNDLFWEAVWPRLLARGWHSKKPKGNIVTGAKHSLVFLTPGVKKISRRKLVKGDHYFDSVTDVLNKVASNPWLLEMEIESANEEKCGSDPTEKHDKRGGVQKLTIVDTSLVNGAEQDKVREVRSLSIGETTCVSTSSSESEEDYSSEDNMSDGRNFKDLSDISSPDKHASVDRMLIRDYLSNFGDACEDTAPSQNKRHLCSIDLNKPPPMLDYEHTVTDVDRNNDSVVSVNNSSLLSETTTREVESFKLLDAGGSRRRQSTRNRPLTTKALEALEMGFFSSNKRKGGDLLWRSNSKSKARKTDGVIVAADTKLLRNTKFSL